MQTKHAQQMKAHNTNRIIVGQNTIFELNDKIRDLKNQLRRDRKQQAKLVNLQKAIKAEIRGNKIPRPEGYRTKSHGRDDPRYVAWYESKQAARAATNNSPRAYAERVIEVTRADIVDNTAAFLG